MTVTHQRPGLGLCARHLCLCCSSLWWKTEWWRWVKKAIFAPSVKSTQIGLLDEWTCLCPFHAGCPFVMPPLLRKQCRGRNYRQNRPPVLHDCDDEPWNNQIRLLSWISGRSLAPFITGCYSHTGFAVLTKTRRELEWHFGSGCFHPHCQLNPLVVGLLAPHPHISPALQEAQHTL